MNYFPGVSSLIITLFYTDYFYF